FLPKPGLSLVVSGCRVSFWIRHLDRDEPGSKPLRWSVGHGAAQRYGKSRPVVLLNGGAGGLVAPPPLAGRARPPTLRADGNCYSTSHQPHASSVGPPAGHPRGQSTG